jgi:hypothetical protein
MKILSTLLLMFSFAITGIAQDYAAVTNALKCGNVSALTEQLTAKIDLTILDFDENCTKDKATSQLAAFFSKYKATKFELVHKGNSPDGKAKYGIGNLTASEQTFRVNIFFKEADGKFQISSLKIEK